MDSSDVLPLKADIVAVRVSKLRHIRALQKLTRTIWRQHFPGIISVEQVEYMLHRFYGFWSLFKKRWKGENFYLIRAGRRHVGYFSYTTEHDSPQAQLNKFFLLKEFRGKGIAHAAFQHIIRRCEKAGCKSIWLAINRRNNDSITAWERLGFKVVREEAFDIGNKFVMDDYIMERRLD